MCLGEVTEVNIYHSTWCVVAMLILNKSTFKLYMCKHTFSPHLSCCLRTCGHSSQVGMNLVAICNKRDSYCIFGHHGMVLAADVHSCTRYMYMWFASE